MKAKKLSIGLLCSFVLVLRISAGALEYQLLPDSTITPHDGGVPIGPSEPLVGSFAWTPYSPSGYVDSLGFNATGLSFDSRGYTLILAPGPQYGSTVSDGPQGETDLYADVKWLQEPRNSYILAGFGEASYTGPAVAPTELFMTEGLGLASGGNWLAYLYIHAKLVTPPPSVQYTTVAFFDEANPVNSEGNLVRGEDGDYYGTTISGGEYGLGNVFKVTAGGKIVSLVSFNGTNGAEPQAGVMLGQDGNFYGTTIYGGSGNGTVFKMTPAGKLTTLVSFDFANGSDPYAGVIQGQDGNFYGTTYYGGEYGNGTVFKVTTGGKLTTLVSFNGANGSEPQAPLVQGTDGNFYGTTVFGGVYYNGDWYSGWGTVFKMTPGGSLTTLASFDGANGANPLSALLPASGGEFYGATMAGGIGFTGTNYTGNGVLFKIGRNGALEILHEFAGAPDEGSNPELNGLVMDSRGSIYGTTYGGGQNGGGSIFRLDASNNLTTLYSFAEDTGSLPIAGLAATAGGLTYYGTTTFGGEFGCGGVFKVTVLTGSLPSQSSLGLKGELGGLK